jgi:hypothetical protein
MQRGATDVVAEVRVGAKPQQRCANVDEAVLRSRVQGRAKILHDTCSTTARARQGACVRSQLLTAGAAAPTGVAGAQHRCQSHSTDTIQQARRRGGRSGEG